VGVEMDMWGADGGDGWSTSGGGGVIEVEDVIVRNDCAQPNVNCGKKQGMEGHTGFVFMSRQNCKSRKDINIWYK
jgi:hypothetical protein